jgi:hypothetical protein
MNILRSWCGSGYVLDSILGLLNTLLLLAEVCTRTCLFLYLDSLCLNQNFPFSVESQSLGLLAVYNCHIVSERLCPCCLFLLITLSLLAFCLLLATCRFSIVLPLLKLRLITFLVSRCEGCRICHCRSFFFSSFVEI